MEWRRGMSLSAIGEAASSESRSVVMSSETSSSPICRLPVSLIASVSRENTITVRIKITDISPLFLVLEKKCKKIEIFLKRGWQMKNWWYNRRPASKMGYHERAKIKRNKKTSKKFEKPLDKSKTSWYNKQADRESGKRRTWSLKIEQQREVQKHERYGNIRRVKEISSKKIISFNK